MVLESLLLALVAGPAGSPAGDEVYWYFDAETALRVAAETGRPIVLLKVRADIGRDVKT